MKVKKPQTGTKRQIREEKKRERRVALEITVAILVAAISISSFFVNSVLNQPSARQAVGTSGLKAAIIDQGSLSPASGPNPIFVENVTNTLKQAGYTVDYFPGEEVTVDFCRNLPKRGYDLIVFRVHSAVTQIRQSLAFFTSEKYDRTKYLGEQLTDRLVAVAYSQEDADKGTVYFGIPPTFVMQKMNGRFENTTIIAMGCEGMTDSAMAEAFIEKGAKVYVGWNESVQAGHTDQATIFLLRSLITQNQTIEQAVENTTKEIGPDPASNAVLRCYLLDGVAGY